MTPPDGIQPVNIIAATILMQIFLILIMYIGVQLIKRIANHARIFNSYPITTLVFAWRILPFSIITIVLLLFSNDFTGLWAPLFPGLPLPTLASSDTVLLVVAANIIFVSYLIYLSGGSQASPFSSILFTLPTLSIFLRVPFKGVLFFVILVWITFSTTYIVYSKPQEKIDHLKGYFSTAFYAISVMCLLLTTLIAYVTRRF